MTDSIANQQTRGEASDQHRLVLLLRGLAFNLWSASLRGNTELFKELRDPQPGDMVMELTTFNMKSRDPLEGIGTLKSLTWEPVMSEEEWRKAGHDDDVPKVKIWTITLDFDDGREFRWENADFIKVKHDIRKQNVELTDKP